MPLSSAKVTSTELRMPQLSKPRINSCKKRSSWTNKKPLPSPNQRPRSKKWSKWMNKELKKCNQPNNKNIKKPRMKPSFQRPKRRWIMSWTMSSKWTKWSSTQKLSPFVTSNLMRTSVSKQSGLKNRKSWIWWWKLRGWRYSRKRKSVRSGNMSQGSKALKSSLTRFKNEQSREWKSKNFVTKKRLSYRPTLKRCEKKMSSLKKPREERSTFSWNKLLKPMPRPSLKNRKEFKKKRIKTKLLLNTKGKRTRLSLKNNKKLRDWEKKKSVRSRDSESFRRRLLIDRLKLMPWGPKELSKRVKEMPEKEKSWSKLRDKGFKLI